MLSKHLQGPHETAQVTPTKLQEGHMSSRCAKLSPKCLQIASKMSSNWLWLRQKLRGARALHLACARACVRACVWRVRACVRVWMHVCLCACVHACVWLLRARVRDSSLRILLVCVCVPSCVCASCVLACIRACVRVACVRACAHSGVRVCLCACVRVCAAQATEQVKAADKDHRTTLWTRPAANRRGHKKGQGSCNV